MIKQYLDCIAQVSNLISTADIEALINILVNVREREGRLFICGVGGSAGNASHAVNDFRKLCGIEAYAPTDNVSELTARINDDGWESAFSNWLAVSRFSKSDCLMVFSVGGGDLDKNVSVNLINAAAYCRDQGGDVIAVLGRDGGVIKDLSTRSVLIPVVVDSLVTPITEAYQAVVWHCLVSHPDLQICKTKW